MITAKIQHRRELKGCAFNIGDSSEFAEDCKKGRWYFTLDKEYYYGPYRTLKAAKSQMKIAVAYSAK